MKSTGVLGGEERHRALLSAIVESSDDAIIGKDLDGTILSWNPGAERLYGYTAEEAIGRSVSILIPEDRADELAAIMDRVRRGERVDHFETVRRTKNGRRLHISLTVSPIRDGQGRITGASAVGRDITQRRRAERTMAMELANHKRLQEISSRLIPADDVRTLYRELVEAAIDITRADRGTMQSLDPETGELVLLETRGLPAASEERFRRASPKASTSCAEAARRGERVVVDYVTDEGVAGTADAQAHLELGIRAAQSTPLMSRAGRTVGILTTHWDRPHRLPERASYLLDILARQAADLIERTQAEEALRENEQRLRFALQAADFGTWDLDLSTPPPHTATRSLKHDQIFGYQEMLPEWNYGSFLDHVLEEDRPRVERSFERAQTGGGGWEFECRIRRADGAIRWIWAHGRAIVDREGRPQRMLGLVSDITERKRAEEALREADRRKDEFLATLGHELRNPLAAIRAAIEVAGEASDEPERVRRMTEIVERQSAQLVRLIDDLLDVSRISLGRMNLATERVDLGGIVRQVVEDSLAVGEEKGLHLSVAVPEEALVVDADPVRFAQVMTNLLDNACSFTPPGGEIRVSVDRSEAEAVVRVADTGIGMAEEKLRGIFEMFTQIDESLGGRKGGLGIGLSLSKTIMELHGGTIQARSEGPGKGSEFLVRLPTAPTVSEDLSDGASGDAAEASGGATEERAPEMSSVDEDHSAVHLARPATMRSPGGRRVLVAEDNRDALDAMALMLRMRGYEVATALDGAEALEKARTHRPDIALLDIGMPGMNGYEVARRIRRAPEGGKVLLMAMTGWGREKDKRRAIEAGFDAHLTKPVDPEVLHDLLQGRDDLLQGREKSIGDATP